MEHRSGPEVASTDCYRGVMNRFGGFRMRNLPLVSQRWYRLMADASMWSVVDVQPLADRFRGAHAGGMVKWLQRRSPGMRELTCVCGQMLIVAHAAHAHLNTESLI